MQRFSITTLVLAIAMALAIAVPVEAKKPVNPDKPDTGFKPMACQVDPSWWNETSTLIAEESGGFNVTPYTVKPGTSESNDVLCVEVRLVDDGTLSDLRVRWLDCQDCGLYRATGKDLRNFNNGEVFSAGVSVADWDPPVEEMTVVVMPAAKSDIATMTVTIGIGPP